MIFPFAWVRLLQPWVPYGYPEFWISLVFLLESIDSVGRRTRDDVLGASFKSSGFR